MNTRVTLAFVAALALIAALVVGLDRFNVGQPAAGGATPTQEPELQVFQFDDRKATAFSATSGEKTARFVKQGEEWKIDGSEEPANRVSLSSLLIRMGSLRASRRVASPASLAEFGLEQPKLSATAELDDGTKQTLLLGDQTPIGSGYYARTADGTDVFVVPTQFGTDVDRLAKDPKEPPTPTPRPSPTEAPSTPTPAGAAGTPGPAGTPGASGQAGATPTP